jgi:ribosomal protein S12 methylthiotransferase
VLIAQDSTSWGKDLAPAADDPARGRPRLADLVRALDGVEGLDWIRLLYVYPSAVTGDLLEALARARRVLPYVDVPLQHASDRVLGLMRRGTTAARQRRLVARLRETIPGVTIRTTFIVGFPGETEEDFTELLGFVRESRFDRVGIFRYSDEEGTAAHALPGKVPRAVARSRYRRLAAAQRAIVAEKLAALVGSETPVLVDARVGSGLALGRLPSQAPEIDGIVYLKGDARPGDLVRARISGVRDVDLDAEKL